MNKSFWQRPEGVTGGIFMVALVAGGALLLNRILPTLIELTENTVYLSEIGRASCRERV